MKRETDRLGFRFILAMVLICFGIGSCATAPIAGSEAVYAAESWLVLPLSNTTRDATGTDITTDLIETQLRVSGVRQVQTVSDPEILRIENLTQDQINQHRYVVTGELEKWRYKKAVDHSPEVSIKLTVFDLVSMKPIWTGHDIRTSRSTLAGAASDSIATLVGAMGIVKAPTTQQLLDAPAETSNITSNVSVARTDLVPVPTAMGVAAPAAGDQLRGSGNMIGKSVAIYYGAKPSLTVWSQFDRLILEPDNISSLELNALKSRGTEPYAYLSVGEIGPTRHYGSAIPSNWVLGSNTVWNSRVLDLANPKWIEFLLDQVTKLHKAGYEGLFLDTLDSYQLYATTHALRERQQLGLISFVRRIKEKYPELKLIANRGFEVLPQIGEHLEALAAESLYSSWNNESARYLDVPVESREWLLNVLVEAKATYGMDIISIDYVSPTSKDVARNVASRIAKHGFIPWVATPGLDTVGVGSLEVMPREVLMLFDSRNSGVQADAEVYRFAATPLEYLGYVPVYHDVATAGIPELGAAGELAGIVSWANATHTVTGVREFVAAHIKQGTPVALLGVPGFSLDVNFSDTLGVVHNSNFDLASATVAASSPLIGFERSLPPRFDHIGFLGRNNSDRNQVHLSIVDKNQSVVDLVVTGPWGGYAAHPATVDVDVDGVSYWIVNPFEFLESALKLKRMPMPDVTSENGRRLWFSHIDGDALPSWAEMPDKKLGAEIIRDRILSRYQYPHTVSVVEAEMTSLDAVKDRRKRMRDAAKSIYKMPHVELASHTYSHPFVWDKLSESTKSGRYNLAIEGYQYSAKREVDGSIEFINRELAPPNKQVEIFLWSGDAEATSEAVAAVERNGIPNMNGGFTTISRAQPTVTLVSPNALTPGDYVQPLAPIMNENVFTNDWLGPFDGFRRVIETLELTDAERRLKPINIYYHFYAGTKRASLRSLEEIYAWAETQDTYPIFASDYARKVPFFRSAGVGRYLDGSWKVSGLGNIRSLRILDGNSWPQIASSRGVVGSRKLNDGIYLHTNGADTVVFKTQQRKPVIPYIVSANAQVQHWDVSSETMRFRLHGHRPVELIIGGLYTVSCSVTTDGKTITGIRTPQKHVLFKFDSKDTGDAVLNCQA